jgi:hypothetical protein
MLLGPMLSSRVLARAVSSVVIALAVGCAPGNGRESQPEPSGDEEQHMEAGFVSSLQAETAGDSVRFTLRVTNASESPVTLTYPTGQTYDFVVQDGGAEVWRWSSDMMFTQAIRTETVAAGETLEFSEWWTPERAGAEEYTVRGHLTAQEYRAEQETRFRVR